MHTQLSLVITDGRMFSAGAEMMLMRDGCGQATCQVLGSENSKTNCLNDKLTQNISGSVDELHQSCKQRLRCEKKPRGFPADSPRVLFICSALHDTEECG